MEKENRERNDKDNINQQAEMWSLDKENYEVEEKRLKDRISRINADNAQFLLKQMADKHKKGAKMNRAEFAINKPLLREANGKFKEHSNYEPSNKSYVE